MNQRSTRIYERLWASGELNGQKKGKEGERIRIEINCKINLKKEVAWWKSWKDGHKKKERRIISCYGSFGCARRRIDRSGDVGLTTQFTQEGGSPRYNIGRTMRAVKKQSFNLNNQSAVTNQTFHLPTTPPAATPWQPINTFSYFFSPPLFFFILFILLFVCVFFPPLSHTHTHT